MKEKKRDIKRKRRPQPRFPQVISEDDRGRVIAYSRNSVSWVPHFHLQPA